MREFEEQLKIRKKYLDRITKKEWKALEEQGQISLLATQAMANLVKRNYTTER